MRRSKIVLDELLAYVRENGRVCPLPNHWDGLWQMLPNRKRAGDRCEPPPPLILAAWYSPALLKAMRLEEHIRYAAAHGALAAVDRYLRSLTEEQWAHLVGNRTNRSGGS